MNSQYHQARWGVKIVQTSWRHLIQLKTSMNEGDNRFTDVRLKLGPNGKDALQDAARRQFANFVPADSSVNCEQKFLRGDPATEILQAAEEVAADLIVMGTHGRTWLAHALVGSVTEEVLRQAKCPVLTVKQPAIAKGERAPEPIPPNAYPPMP